MLLMEFIELGADFPPDASLFGDIFDERWAEVLQAMATAKVEKEVPALDVVLVVLTRMVRFEFKDLRVRRFDHRLSVDGHSILGQGFFHRTPGERER